MGSDPVLLACVVGAPFDAVRVLGDRPSVRGLIAVRTAGAFVGPPLLGWIQEIEIADPHDFCGCFQVIADRLPRIVRARGLAPSDLVVDVSGAPQPLASAVTMAAAPHTTTMRFETNDDWPGAGDANPWEALTVSWVPWAVELFDRARHDDAAIRFGELAALCPSSRAPLFTQLAGACEAFAAWDRLEYAGLPSRLTERAMNLAAWTSPRRHKALARLVQSLLDASRRAEPLARLERRALAADGIANADRRARLDRRYDDAVLRLSNVIVFMSGDPTRAFLEGELVLKTHAFGGAEHDYERIRSFVMKTLKIADADLPVFPRLAEFDLASLI
jgi:hypothetical protein